jgi:hypothetical protein
MMCRRVPACRCRFVSSEGLGVRREGIIIKGTSFGGWAFGPLSSRSMEHYSFMKDSWIPC